MIYAYTRISTDRQELEGQEYSIKNFIESDLKVLAYSFVSETVSGKVSWRRRELGKLIDTMVKNDTLVISELSRLGRSMLEVMELLSVLTQKQIKVISIKEGFKLEDNIQSKVIAFAYSMCAELERQLISVRTKEALASKRSQGVILGRPKGSTDSYQRKRRK
ncbi:MAG: hypothetical protein A2W17_12515 [Planctomycetes bacterium RBG_16_41_13]|nr:MAG: hypothetical protein A2W17_12515 [Planctomycetes bacterium RBG_16_41_13]